MRFLIIFIFLITNSYANEVPDIKNLIINKELKKYDSLTFLDTKNAQLDLKDFKGKLILLNFWATWCAPCKEEMPSLDNLAQNESFKNLVIFPVNMENINYEKSEKFFLNLKIKKLKIFFDTNLNFVKELKLRGVPTTVLINKKGEEFARIIGSIDFKDKEFLDWLLKYD